jgi:hypothetical protein
VTGLIGLRIPIGPPSRTNPLTYVERRMTDRVVRDVWVMTDIGEGDSESVQTRTGAPIENAYFFDAEDDTPDCSYENPCAIETAIDTGMENALLIGLNRTGDINLSGDRFLYDGQTVMGGGTGLIVYGQDSGQMAVFQAPGGPATLCCTGTALNLAENNTIEGLTFQDMGTALALDVDTTSTMVDIYNNSFRNMGTAVWADVHADSQLTAYVWNNLFEHQGTGIGIEAWDTFDVNLQVYGNSFFEMGTGVAAQLSATGAFGPSRWTDEIRDNTFESMDTGIEVQAAFLDSEDYTHHSNVHDNYFKELDYDDYELHVFGKAPSGALDLQVRVAFNRSEDGDTFFDFELDPIPNGLVDLDVVDNDIENADGTAIDIEVYSGPDVDATISRNRIESVGGDAIEVDVYGSGSQDGHTLTIADNEIRDAADDGINVYFDNSYDAQVSVTGNDIAEIFGDDGGGDAIRVAFYENGHDQGDAATISNNTITDVEDDGIDVFFGYGYDGMVTVSDNAISSAGDDGVEIDLRNSGHDTGNTATVQRNTINQTSGDGIQIDSAYGYDTAVTVTDNTLEDVGEDGGDGINVRFFENGHDQGDSATITGNDVTQAGDDGIDVYFGYGYDGTVTIANNTLGFIGEDGGDGIEVEFFENGHDVGNTASINDNDISDVEDDGIDVDFEYGYDGTLTIGGNTIERTEGDGIDVIFHDNGHNVGNSANINGNTITDADDDGIDVYAGQGYDTDVSVANNTITNVGDGPENDDGNGIEIDFFENGHNVGDTATITGNRVDEAEDDGIDVDFEDGYDGTATITGNNVSNVGDDGIDVYFYENGHNLGNTASITGNVIDEAGGTGIEVGFGYDDTSLTISGNTIGNVDYGIYVYFDEVDNATGTIANNIINEVEKDGIDVYFSFSDGNEFTISGNQVTGSGVVPESDACSNGDDSGCGIAVSLHESDDNTVVISGNQVQESDFAGIAASVDQYSENNTVAIGGNSVDQSDVYGIAFDSEDASTTLTGVVNGSTQNNNVTNSGIDDTAFDGPFTGTIRVNGVDVPI